jgi:hypothetical protein
MSAVPAARPVEAFAEAGEEFRQIETYLKSEEAGSLSHSDLERELEKRGRELMRMLLQAHLDVRGPGEAAGPIKGSDGVQREQERLQERGLETIFGEVTVQRIGYGGDGVSSVHPLDADLNLPEELYSHEVRRRVAERAADGSFDAVVRTVSQATGAKVAKRQVEQLAVRAAQDFDAFYEARAECPRPEVTSSILVVTVDGKGVVMRPSDLREYTRKKAAEQKHKLQTRLSPGEKRNAKRMATVAAVYTIAPHVRTPEDVVRTLAPHNEREPPHRPRPEYKRVWASLEKTPEEVIKQAIREARFRDPGGLKTMVVLVDGLPHQLDVLRKLFRRYGIRPLIVLDFIHVAQYIWKAGIAFYGEGNPKLDLWVSKHLLAILRGRSGHVAAGLRRSATLRGLDGKNRKAVDHCANYLLNNARYLHYDLYLSKGLPIATGVIEGACRYLIKDRMDITGARWGLAGAEAVLRLRALLTNGDLDAYWRFHEKQEYVRNHTARYAEGKVAPLRPRNHRHKLRRVK